MNKEIQNIIERISEQDTRYKEDAYAFVMEALNYTQKKCKSSKHVKGGELLESMKELLIQRFGLMTMTVLDHWGIKETADFGHIVFNLIDNNVLSKTDEDNLDEFMNYFDFEEVFDRDYRKRLAKKISRMRSF
ncbi:MAG: hypothetical protein K8S27_10860 [Candidatus Omnitrophica bacterium]|nr:hypothetical protein [Candidatus Omnitrophota bacterium]